MDITKAVISVEIQREAILKRQVMRHPNKSSEQAKPYTEAAKL
jgi:hypothetical protein